MAVDSLQKTAETAVRGRPFRKGQSGNPKGRPRGARNRKTTAAELLLENEEALTRKAVDLALEGDSTALRLCLERTVPKPRERAVQIALPPLKSATDPAPVMAAIAAATAQGRITPGEAVALAQVVETAIRAIETGERAAQRAELARMAARPWKPRSD